MPYQKRCNTRSKVGTRNKFELVIEVQPRTSSERNLYAFLRMRSMEALSSKT